MPIEERNTTRLDVDAAAYWSLRRDHGFDWYCANADNCTFTLHSETEEEDENGDKFIIVESTNSYERSSVPGPIQGLLKKGEGMQIWSRFRFYAHLFDECHLATFETRPSFLADKLVISGDVWCEPIESNACNLHTRHSVSCTVFGIGGLIEKTILSQVKGTYKSLSQVTQAYMSTQSYAEFLQRTGAASTLDGPCSPTHAATDHALLSPVGTPAAVSLAPRHSAEGGKGGDGEGAGMDSGEGTEPSPSSPAEPAAAPVAEPGWMWDPGSGGFIRLPEPGWRYDAFLGGYVRLPEPLGEGDAPPDAMEPIEIDDDGSAGASSTAAMTVSHVRASAVLTTLDLMCTQLRETLSDGADDGMIASALLQRPTDMPTDGEWETRSGSNSASSTPLSTPRSSFTLGRHPSTAAPSTQGGASKMQGWLRKRGQFNTAPRRRWFTLDNGQLVWYAKPPPSGPGHNTPAGQELAIKMWSHGRVSLVGACAASVHDSNGAPTAVDTSNGGARLPSVGGGATNGAGPSNRAESHGCGARSARSSSFLALTRVGSRSSSSSANGTTPAQGAQSLDSGESGYEFTIELARSVRRPSISAALAHKVEAARSKASGHGPDERVLHLIADSEAERQVWLLAVLEHSGVSGQLSGGGRSSRTSTHGPLSSRSEASMPPEISPTNAQSTSPGVSPPDVAVAEAARKLHQLNPSSDAEAPALAAVIKDLEAQKKAAVEIEDFDEAKRLKLKLEELRRKSSGAGPMLR